VVFFPAKLRRRRKTAASGKIGSFFLEKVASQSLAKEGGKGGIFLGKRYVANAMVFDMVNARVILNVEHLNN